MVEEDGIERSVTPTLHCMHNFCVDTESKEKIWIIAYSTAIITREKLGMYSYDFRKLENTKHNLIYSVTYRKWSLPLL